MALAQLTDDEKEVVYECLKCIASGKVILHDDEFSTIIGLEVEEFLDIFSRWPQVDDSQEAVHLAINNSMNNLLGYPHGKYARWDEFLSVPQGEVARVFAKWREGASQSYFGSIC